MGSILSHKSSPILHSRLFLAKCSGCAVHLDTRNLVVMVTDGQLRQPKSKSINHSIKVTLKSRATAWKHRPPLHRLSMLQHQVSILNRFTSAPIKPYVFSLCRRMSTRCRFLITKCRTDGCFGPTTELHIHVSQHQNKGA